MQFGEMNLDALKRSIDFVVGPDGTAQVATAYHQFAAAMQSAYNEGFLAGQTSAEENVEERLDNAFDEGFEQGASFQELADEADTEITAKECYEDGYLEAMEDGYRDVRAADAKVQAIMAGRAARYFEALEDARAEPEDEAVCGVCGSSHCECGPDDEQVEDEA